MKEIRIKDAIIGLGKDKYPLFGSVQYERPAKTNTIVTVQTDNKTVQIPLNQIKLIVFKYDAKTFGFIFNYCLFISDNKSFNLWNRQTKKLTCHELQPNF
ncbi:hypothetical protein HF869_06250 [Lactobacillus amylovorus subsp. animalium]|uniref:hypothetical protein n=1 Tax=Lactobacillus amylovorus TaxID=1604 RepID=UPI001475B96F|nr:hypothetical protein [Lactobacillus amylovorus]NME30646.1 hypothetical protein [Lactobacillus amylovorus]